MNSHPLKTETSNNPLEVVDESKKRGTSEESLLAQPNIPAINYHLSIISHLQTLYTPAISKDETRGVCYGIAWMGAQAILADDICAFDERIKMLGLIDSKDLAEKIAKAKEAEKNRIHGKVEEPLSLEQMNLFSAEAFLEGVILSQSPGSYIEWFKGSKPHCVRMLKKDSKSMDNENFSTSRFFPIQNVKLTLPFTLSDALMIEEKTKDSSGISYLQKTPGVAEVDPSIMGVYDFTELVDYFKTLREMLVNQKPSLRKPVAFMLNSSNHTISIGWNFKSRTWIFIDANQLPVKREDSCEGIARKTIAAFTQNETTLFSTKMYVHKSELKQTTECMNRLKSELKEVDVTKATKKDSHDASLIHIVHAAEECDHNTIKRLLDLKVDVNLQTKRGATALEFAIVRGQVEVVKLLLKHQANIHLTNKTGQTALHSATEAHHIGIVKLLLDAGAKTNPPACVPLLHFAVIKGQIEIVKLLLDKKADIDLQTEKDLTVWTNPTRSLTLELRHSALDFAVLTDKIEIVNLLLDEGAKINDLTLDLARATHKDKILDVLHVKIANLRHQRLLQELRETEELSESNEAPFQGNDELKTPQAVAQKPPAPALATLQTDNIPDSSYLQKIIILANRKNNENKSHSDDLLKDKWLDKLFKKIVYLVGKEGLSDKETNKKIGALAKSYFLFKEMDWANAEDVLRQIKNKETLDHLNIFRNRGGRIGASIKQMLYGSKYAETLSDSRKMVEELCDYIEEVRNGGTSNRLKGRPPTRD